MEFISKTELVDDYVYEFAERGFDLSYTGSREA